MALIRVKFIFLMGYIFLAQHTEGNQVKKFPKGFLFGAATAAYQVEGGNSEEGKGENIWDRLIHSQPDKIPDGGNADIACDSYHRYKEDVRLLKEIGFNHYRFSISWSRILPTGYENYINKKGLQYYHNLIDELLKNGIEPMVTIFHWDLPLPLQELGGWANPVIANYFENYARILFTEFGNKVKWWVTINEPLMISVCGYGLGSFAPEVNQTGIADYLATYTILIAHAKVYHLYKRHFASFQRGQVGITTHGAWFIPKTNSRADIEATERALQFMVGIHMHPIFSKKGDFPDVVKQMVAKCSKEEGWFSSRLPAFSPKEIMDLRGSADFFGLNHYTSWLVEDCKDPAECEDMFTNPEAKVTLTADPDWPTSAQPDMQAYPNGIRKLLNWIKDEYNNPPVVITENGWSTYSPNANLDDQPRVDYYIGYLTNVLDAIIEDKCDVRAYTAWSLLDAFEWTSGYKVQFGVCYVDFNNTERPRIKRESAYLLKEVIETRQVPTSWKARKTAMHHPSETPAAPQPKTYTSSEKKN